MTLIKRSMLHAKLPELGKIKIGGKGPKRPKSGGGHFRMPVKFEHFVLTTIVRENGEDDGNFERDVELHELVGSEPTELDCHLPFPEIEQNFMSRFQEYAGRKLKVTCDGETRRDEQTGNTAECTLKLAGDCDCKPYGRLAVQLDKDRLLGLRTFRSTSWLSVNNLQTALEWLYETFGTCKGIPLRLELYEAPVKYIDKGVEKTSTAWVVTLTIRVTLEEAQQLARETMRRGLANQREVKLLAGGVNESLDAQDLELQGDIGDEYHPDQTGPAQVATAERTSEISSALDAELEANDEPGAPTLEGEVDEELPTSVTAATKALGMVGRQARRMGLLGEGDAMAEALTEIKAAKERESIEELNAWIDDLRHRIRGAGQEPAA